MNINLSARIILIISILSSINTADICSQDIPPTLNDFGGRCPAMSRKERYTVARENILQLKNGALVIILDTKRNQLAALRKIGNEKLADKIERRQSKRNLKIIQGFRSHFSFCPVYFCKPEYFENVANSEMKKVIFVNESLLPDSSIYFSHSNFLTAQYGTVEQDQWQTNASVTNIPGGNWSVQRLSNYNGGPNTGIRGLIFKNNKFTQLKRPFPYYVRTYDTSWAERKPFKIAKRANKKLFKFYYNYFTA